MTIALRDLLDQDLDELFRWESDPAAAEMAAFTRADPADRAAFDSHYQRVRSNPENTLRVIEENGVPVGTIASFTVDGSRELAYWIDPTRWGRGIASAAAVKVFIGVETRRPLFARAAAHNVGSAKVLTRNGFMKIREETAWTEGVANDVLEFIYRLD